MGRGAQQSLMEGCEEDPETQISLDFLVICLNKQVSAISFCKYLNTVTPKDRMIRLCICSYVQKTFVFKRNFLAYI